MGNLEKYVYKTNDYLKDTSFEVLKYWKKP